MAMTGMAIIDGVLSRLSTGFDIPGIVKKKIILAALVNHITPMYVDRGIANKGQSWSFLHVHVHVMKKAKCLLLLNNGINFNRNPLFLRNSSSHARISHS